MAQVVDGTWDFAQLDSIDAIDANKKKKIPGEVWYILEQKRIYLLACLSCFFSFAFIKTFPPKVVVVDDLNLYEDLAGGLWT